MDYSFSDNIMKLRYSWDQKETWEDITKRVVHNVIGCTNFMGMHEIEKELIDIISKIKVDRAWAESIRNNGFKRAISEHTYEHRLNKILNNLNI